MDWFQRIYIQFIQKTMKNIDFMDALDGIKHNVDYNMLWISFQLKTNCLLLDITTVVIRYNRTDTNNN